MHQSAMKSEVRRLIADGTVIPAHPLALDANRKLDTVHQRALTRYYIDAGAGGLAVGVHTTQFAIRDVGMYKPVLELAAETAANWTKRPLAMVAGLVGPTQQAVAEAKIARGIGYHAGLLSLAAMKSSSEDEIIAHCEAVAREIPLVGLDRGRDQTVRDVQGRARQGHGAGGSAGARCPRHRLQQRVLRRRQQLS